MRLQIADLQIADWRAWLVVAALGAAVLHAETIDRVLAVAADQLITLSDVTAAIDLGLQSTDGAADPVRAVLTKLIDRELVLAEVDRYAPAEPTTEAVDREVHAGAAAVRRRRPRSTRRWRARGSTRSTCAKRCARICGCAPISISASARRRDRRPNAVDEWMASLRRRGGVIDLYLAGAKR